MRVAVVAAGAVGAGGAGVLACAAAAWCLSFATEAIFADELAAAHLSLQGRSQLVDPSLRQANPGTRSRARAIVKPPV